MLKKTKKNQKKNQRKERILAVRSYFYSYLLPPSSYLLYSNYLASLIAPRFLSRCIHNKTKTKTKISRIAVRYTYIANLVRGKGRRGRRDKLGTVSAVCIVRLVEVVVVGRL